MVKQSNENKRSLLKAIYNGTFTIAQLAQLAPPQFYFVTYNGETYEYEDHVMNEAEFAEWKKNKISSRDELILIHEELSNEPLIEAVCAMDEDELSNTTVETLIAGDEVVIENESTFKKIEIKEAPKEDAPLLPRGVWEIEDEGAGDRWPVACIRWGR